MPSNNANDPSQKIAVDPSTGTPALDRTVDFKPGFAAADEASTTFIPDHSIERERSVPVRVPSSVSVPGYQIEGVLGRGGMGVVYKARHISLKRTVALKMVLAGGHAGPRELARFRIEAEAVARLQHPNIVQIHEIGEADGHPYCALEFVEGGNLASRIDGKPMPPREAAKLIETLARAMQLAHSRNVVHRDLKPANILLTADGTPKITDFGLARQTDSDSGETQAGAVMGTPSYMAPEQASGNAHEAGPAADVYALGAILYDCLTGRPPFKGKSVVETLDQVRTQEPMPPSRFQADITLDLETICLKCLRKEPENRYASAAELANELVRFQQGEPILARPLSRVERAMKWVRRNPLVTGAAATVAVALVAGVIVSSYFAFEASIQAKKANESAATAKNRAKEADTERNTALRALEDTKRLQGLAAQQLEIANRRVYVSDMRLALQSLESNRIGQVQLMLEQHKPSPPAPDLRGWEWYYLRAACNQDLHTFRGHYSWIDSLAWSPDGTRLASGSGDAAGKKTLRVWDAETGKEAFTCVGHTGNVAALAWCSDDTTLAVAGSGGLRLWNGRTGEMLRSLDSEIGSVRSLAWSPDGKWLAAGRIDGTIVLWNVIKLSVERTLTGHTSGVGRVIWNSDGSRLASSSSDYSVRVWNPESEDAERIFELNSSVVPSNWILEFAWSPDGRHLAWEGDSRSVQIVDVSSGLAEVTCEGNTLGALTLQYSEDGRHLAVVQGGQVRVWDVAVSGPPVLSTSCSVAAWIRKGKLIALAVPETDMVTLYDPAARQFVQELPANQGEIYSLAWNGTKERLSSAGSDGTVKVWFLPYDSDASHTNAWSRKKKPFNSVATAWRPDGRKYALAHDDQTISIWETTPQQQVRTIQTPGHVPLFLAWSPDGQRLVSTDGFNTPILWDPEQGRQLKTLESSGPADQFQWSHDGRYLAARCAGPNTIAVWELEDGKIVSRLGHEVITYTWSPGSLKLAWSGSGYGNSFVHDLVVGQEVRVNDFRQATRIAWSPDGQKMAATRWNAAVRTGAVEIWDVKSGDVVNTLEGHESPIVQLVWSPDSSRVLSVAKTMKIWDPQTGSEILSFSVHGDHQSVACWWPDGQRISLADFDTVHVWNAARGYDRGKQLPSNTIGTQYYRPRVAMNPVGQAEHFVCSWCYFPHAETWSDISFLPVMTAESLLAIETDALASAPEGSPTAVIDLRQRFPQPESNVLCYAARRIVTTEARKVRLLTGSDDTLRIWLNGTIVLDSPRPRMTVPDSDSVLIELQPGDNRLLVEVGQYFGNWSFCLRLEDEAGQTLRLTNDDHLEPLTAPH